VGGDSVEVAVEGDTVETAVEGDGNDNTSNETIVWILPYKANNAIACASNSQSIVETAQKELLRLDLVHPDDVTFWEAVLDSTHTLAKKRLNDVVEAFKASPTAPIERAEMDKETVASFIEYAARSEPQPEPKRINLLESVIPRDLFAVNETNVDGAEDEEANICS